MWKVPIILAAGFLIISAASSADVIYRWRDAQGVLHYSDTPPGEGARDVKMLRVPGQSVGGWKKMPTPAVTVALEG